MSELSGGERRRRREEERRRLAALEAEAGHPGGADPVGRPLSRRELRERAQAEAAAHAVQQENQHRPTAPPPPERSRRPA
ncbi:hypothetical protein, partial [Cellulomonas bogoriensis]|uniref:hypothetical protein n=1 Tax=Cellulomonas bogoriensis TaxID=301388 RepID=UPI0038BA761E